MKNMVFVGIAILIIIGLVLFISNKKKSLTSTNLTSTTTTTNSESNKAEEMFKDITDMCNVISKEQVADLLGKPILKTVPVTTNTIHSCQYYLNESQAVIVNFDRYNVENQKKGHEVLGRKIVTNPRIPMEHFLVIQEDGLINEIYLVINPNEYVSINRTSGKTLSEDEVVTFAAKLAGVLTGKIPVVKSPSSTPTSAKAVVPLPQETDIINTFFNLIEEKRPSDAVGMMISSIINNDSQKQAWAVQLNAISSIKVLNIEPSMQGDWTDTEHSYKVTMDVQMNSDSANAPIPYYGWSNGTNVRWIGLEKEGNLWKIKGIATGP